VKILSATPLNLADTAESEGRDGTPKLMLSGVSPTTCGSCSAQSEQYPESTNHLYIGNNTMPKDDWAKARNKQIGQRESQARECESLRGSRKSFFKKLNAKNAKTKAAKAANPLQVQAKRSGVKPGIIIYEKMVCMNCLRVTTTEDKHVRRGARVHCAECGGLITLLHQHENQDKF